MVHAPTSTRLPDFFIAGIPKSGTTALYEYLAGHPQVFFTSPKEPLFYAEDLGDHREIRTRDAYQALFRHAGPQHRCVGDASVWYMHSQAALPRVRQELPDARLVVLLRHPVDFLRSLHWDFVWVCAEDEPDFERAWALQPLRRAGLSIPARCQVRWFLDYEALGRLGRHLARLLDTFPRRQVGVWLYDDFAQAPQRVYAEVLSFLGLPHDGRQVFPRINAGKQSRLGWLAQAQATMVQTLPRGAITLGKRCGLGWLNRTIVRLNTRPAAAPPLREAFRRYLLDQFRPDIEILEDLLGRDLTAWKQ